MSKLIRQRHLQAALQKTKAYVAQQVSQLAKAAASDLAKQGLGPCTHKKTGQVHALSADAEAQNLRFTASADFAAGDTFTLNGKAIAARTPSGEGLWSGCFKKGAEVVCHKGTAGLTFSAPGLGAVTRQLLDRFYPVGSIFQTANAGFDPAAAWGGTWERIQGRFLFAADAGHPLGALGGEENHTLTIDELPRHSHSTLVDTNVAYGGSPGWDTFKVATSGKTETGETGKNQTHNNMPPYIAVNIWKRTK